MVEPEFDIKALEAGMSEITKSMNALMHSFGFTDKEDYEGIYPLLFIIYSEYIKEKPYLKASDSDMIQFYHEIRLMVRGLTAMSIALSKWAGMAESDVKGLVSGAESLGKWIESNL